MFRPSYLDLPAAIALVRKRLGLADRERDSVRDAIREDALPLYYDDKPRDGAWFASAKVWWPNPYAYTSPKGEEISCHDIRVSTLDLDRLWPDPSAVPRRRGGAPSKHDWEGALIELSRLNHVDGIAGRSQADLVRHLQDWFICSAGSAPDEKDIKLRVKRFRGALGE